MKFIFIILFFFTSVSAQERPLEEGWKGIKVFLTNRSEVEKILGSPVKDNAQMTSYRTNEGLIHIVYSHKACSNTGDGRFDVQKNTVLHIDINLDDEKEIDLSDLKWSKKLYERYEDPELPLLVHYANLKNGIRMQATMYRTTEKVHSISYETTKEMESKFNCKQF